MRSTAALAVLILAAAAAGADASRLLRGPGAAAPAPGPLAAAGAFFGRALRQVTDSVVTQGGNQYRNPLQIYAHAREAESWSHAKAIGIFLKQDTATVVTAGDTYPSGRSQALTENAQQRGGRARSTGGFPAANVATLFGPTAISTTDTGYRAFSGSGALPMQDRTYALDTGHRAVTASTTVRWDATPWRSGRNQVAGSRNLINEASGATERAPLSQGISESGAGPTAWASAGEAVAVSFADTNENSRMGDP